MGECEKHGDMMRVIGEQVEANRQQTEQIGAIFKLLGEIKTTIDQNAVRAEVRDAKLCEIDRKIENGLRSEVTGMSRKMEQLITCMDRRKRERDLERETGVEGFFRKGWVKIYNNGGLLAILAAAYLIMWTLKQMGLFDSPAHLLRLLGGG